jgi:hypothetical protein
MMIAGGGVQSSIENRQLRKGGSFASSALILIRISLR